MPPVPEDERAALPPVVAEHDVLRDGERADEPEVLVHHADTRVERVARRVELHLLAVELDRPLVRAVQARQDVRQRRLARAVLPQQRVDLACESLEVDPLIRDDTGEALRDAEHAHGEVRRGAGVTGASRFGLLEERGSSLSQLSSPSGYRSRP